MDYQANPLTLRFHGGKDAENAFKGALSGARQQIVNTYLLDLYNTIQHTSMHPDKNQASLNGLLPDEHHRSIANAWRFHHLQPFRGSTWPALTGEVVPQADLANSFQISVEDLDPCWSQKWEATNGELLCKDEDICVSKLSLVGEGELS